MPEPSNEETSDPGFKEKRSFGSGRGNLTGHGALTGERPLVAASYILKKYTKLNKGEWNNLQKKIG